MSKLILTTCLLVAVMMPASATSPGSVEVVKVATRDVAREVAPKSARASEKPVSVANAPAAQGDGTSGWQLALVGIAVLLLIAGRRNHPAD